MEGASNEHPLSTLLASIEHPLEYAGELLEK